MTTQRRTAASKTRDMRSGDVVGWWHREKPASVSHEMLLAGLGSVIGGSFCVALGTFVLLFQRF